MDSTQAVPAKVPLSRAILVTLATLGSGNIAFASGITARTLGDLPPYEALATGAGTFVTGLFVSLAVMAFIAKAEGPGA